GPNEGGEMRPAATPSPKHSSGQKARPGKTPASTQSVTTASLQTLGVPGAGIRFTLPSASESTNVPAPVTVHPNQNPEVSDAVLTCSTYPVRPGGQPSRRGHTRLSSTLPPALRSLQL